MNVAGRLRITVIIKSMLILVLMLVDNLLSH